MDLSLFTDLFGLVADHQWAAVAAFVIGTLVWLTKDGTPTSLYVPARWRPVLALALGQASAIVHVIATGAPWQHAVGEGLLATGIAIMGHVFGIEVLRNGKEILEQSGASPPSPPKAGSAGPLLAGLAYAVAGSCIGLVIGAGILLASCSSQQARVKAVDAVALSTNAAMQQFADWQVKQTDCTGLTDLACVEHVRARSPELWDAWDAFAAVGNAYEEAVEDGGAPSQESMIAAYCVASALLPADAPDALMTLFSCAEEP